MVYNFAFVHILATYLIDQMNSLVTCLGYIQVFFFNLFT